MMMMMMRIIVNVIRHPQPQQAGAISSDGMAVDRNRADVKHSYNVQHIPATSATSYDSVAGNVFCLLFNSSPGYRG